MRYTAGPEHEGMRLDVFLSRQIPDRSRASLQKAIRAGGCRVDSIMAQDPSLRLKNGQSAEIAPEEAQTRLQPASSDISVLWQDNCLAVVNKPAGLTTHPCPSCGEETLAHRLLSRFPQLELQGGERPGIVHRLDKDTSGLMVIALSESSRMALSAIFAERKASKTYLAIVAGNPPEAGQCHEPIGRHPSLKTRMAVVPLKRGGKEAITSWRKLWAGNGIALLEIRILTGRTHQIRVHMAHLGWPIAGDRIYAPKRAAALAPRQMLHAWKLGLPHPRDGRMLSFQAPPPDDFFATALAHGAKPDRIVITGNQGCGKSSFTGVLASAGLPAISADAIVAELYGPKGQAAEWIGSHFPPEVLESDNSVNKAALFLELKKRPHMRHELETVAHGLVRDRIEQFWKNSEASGHNAAVAEVPLYFESGGKNVWGNVLTIGVSCPQKIRWQRIAASRGWNMDKIRSIEEWQWDEKRKMDACDMVIDNSGSPRELRRQADSFLAWLREKSDMEKRQLASALRSLCGVEPE